ncbi:uncharacterized protein PHALS_01032 [Plasmopara halstedii]|uniref:Uncharacterized protein n=1 Tax=Plasmopara halstedii TaxID=4781 RepID=A0A0P1ASE9_PLAHL|nr:uncharacterized protein PHALS_01032 [Plasmopara halstedii]CEG44685.1 hypothetical protein PHALS_01032 [Plasmopara halstedii]|eukprot:XP_024581054.1 hypothetical protein PHALS_01032 [Plasmopara halstedii]
MQWRRFCNSTLLHANESKANAILETLNATPLEVELPTTKRRRAIRHKSALKRFTGIMRHSQVWVTTQKVKEVQSVAD